MATTNQLDASGLLYEGSDFEEWHRALRPILVQHFPGISWPSPYSRIYLPPKVSCRDVCESIWWHVSPHVRCRVSETDRELPQQLVLALQATAQPFRFMDLPAEIRLRIYQLELPAKNSMRRFTLFERRNGIIAPPFEYNKPPLNEPYILSISHQIRAEALPVYHRRIDVNLIFDHRAYSKFGLALARREYRPTNAARVDAMHRWASTITPDNIRNLRRISVQLPLLAICTTAGEEDMLHFSLTVIKSRPELRIAPHVWLKPDSQELLRNHAGAISSMARTLKLEGEALIMVLVSRPDIWDQLELTDKWL